MKFIIFLSLLLTTMSYLQMAHSADAKSSGLIPKPTGYNLRQGHQLAEIRKDEIAAQAKLEECNKSHPVKNIVAEFSIWIDKQVDKNTKDQILNSLSEIDKMNVPDSPYDECTKSCMYEDKNCEPQFAKLHFERGQFYCRTGNSSNGKKVNVGPLVKNMPGKVGAYIADLYNDKFISKQQFENELSFMENQEACKTFRAKLEDVSINKISLLCSGDSFFKDHKDEFIYSQYSPKCEPAMTRANLWADYYLQQENRQKPSIVLVDDDDSTQE